MELLVALGVTLAVLAIAALVVWRVTHPQDLPPVWVPPIMVALTIAGLLASLVIGSILNIATFVLLTLSSVVFVLDARARRRSSR